ncbi:diacylglycerol kinase [Patescibacteria group bacterium]
MNLSSGKCVARIVSALLYSIEGFRAAWNYEASFRQEIILTSILTPLAFIIGQSFTQSAVLLIVVYIVLIVELVNSAVESVVDRIGDEYHELSRRAKDMGSAAVFLSLVLCFAIWTLIIWQNYF